MFHSDDRPVNDSFAGDPDEHLEEDEIERLVRGEWPADDEPESAARRDHLAACGECTRRAERFVDAEAAIAQALTLADHPVPPVAVEVVIRRATRRRVPRATRAGMAAGIATLLAAGVAAATVVPGSPVRTYLQHLLHRAPAAIPAVAPRVQEPRVLPVRVPAAVGEAAGIAFRPGRQVVIEFVPPPRGGEIRISLTSDSLVHITARGAGASPAYALSTAGVIVRTSGAGAHYVVAIPRDVPSLRVRVADATLFAITDRHITTAAEQRRGGEYRLIFTPTGSLP